MLPVSNTTERVQRGYLKRDRIESTSFVGDTPRLRAASAACFFAGRPVACRKTGRRWERRNLTAEPRSAYLLRGPSRTEWEHGIPAVDILRYSITFRNFLEESSKG